MIPDAALPPFFHVLPPWPAKASEAWWSLVLRLKHARRAGGYGMGIERSCTRNGQHEQHVTRLSHARSHAHFLTSPQHFWLMSPQGSKCLLRWCVDPPSPPKHLVRMHLEPVCVLQLHLQRIRHELVRTHSHQRTYHGVPTHQVVPRSHADGTYQRVRGSGGSGARVQAPTVPEFRGDGLRPQEVEDSGRWASLLFHGTLWTWYTSLICCMGPAVTGA